MGEQDAGARSAPTMGADQSAVLRKLAGRLDGLTTGEVPRLIRPGEDGYGDGPAMPVIDPDEYRAETGREWTPDLATAGPAASPQAEPPPPQSKTAPKSAQTAKAGQAKAAGPQGKAKPSSAKPQQGKGKGKAAQGKARPAGSAQGKARPQQAGSAPTGQQPRADTATAKSGRPQPPKQAAAARRAHNHKRPGFWARLWAKLTGG